MEISRNEHPKIGDFPEKNLVDVSVEDDDDDIRKGIFSLPNPAKVAGPNPTQWT